MTLPTKLSDEEKILLEKYALLKRKRKELHQKQVAALEAQKAVTQKPSVPKRVLDRHPPKGPPAPKKTAADNLPPDDTEEKKEFKRANSLVHKKTTKDTHGHLTDQSESPSRPNEQTDFSRVPPYQYDDRERRPSYDRRKGNTLFVAGYGVDEPFLKKAFEKYGPILRLHLEPMRGHGFVTLQSADAAEKAINEMHGEMVQGVTLRVSLARRQNYSEGRGHHSSFSDRRERRPSFPPQVPAERNPTPVSKPPSDAAPKQDRDLVSYSDDFDF